MRMYLNIIFYRLKLISFHKLSFPEGNLVNFIEGGPSNHEHFANGYDETGRILYSSLTELLKPYGLLMSDISYAVFGLAGVDIPEQQKELSNRIAQFGIRKFKVLNDAFPGIKAGSSKGYGICSINGSGTVCAGIDKHGRMLQIGGTGSYFGDHAGGSYLGGMAIKKAYDSFFRCGKKTILSDMILEILGISDPEYIVQAVYEKILASRLYKKNNEGGINLRDLCKLVFSAANKGDEVALDILRKSGRETAKNVAGAIKWLDFAGDDEIDVVLAGSVYVKGENPALIDAFKEELCSHVKSKIRYIIAKSPPVAGAVVWAIEELHGKPDYSIWQKVTASL